VPDSNQVEQENNARKLVQLGVCRRVLYSDLSLDTLRRAVGEVLHNDAYRKQAEQLAAKAALIDGAYQTAEILRDYASRLSAY
jgi:UDP:flavonoid glycosyltransferase YjiC (YdhE family)